MRHRKSSRTRGQAMAEFVLVAPFFLLLLFSIIEFGRAVYYVQMLGNAAREGARYAIIHGADSWCPSGPMPPTTPPTSNPCDPNGAKVVTATKQHAIGVIDASANAFNVKALWCSKGFDVSTCDDDPATYPLGTGNNGRGEYVQVSISYTFQPLIAGVVPLPNFTLTGGSTLVVNH
jgi:Flp pilus assembly protein TadG